MLETDLIELIWKQFGDELERASEDARRFLRGVAEHGGLLEAQDDEYGFFTHATFQEYLAGRYLAEEYTPEEHETFLEKHIHDDQWEESLRLAAGYLSIKGQKQADRFVNLMAAFGKTDEQRARAVTLAGLALSDIRVDRRLPETVKSISDDMLAAFSANPPRVSARLRQRLGLALGEVGDPRFLASPVGRGAGDEAVTIILPELASVAAGVFRMGSSPEDEKMLKEQKTKIYDDEKPAREVYVSAFEIGKYPVTNAEFRLFWEQKGYEQAAFWSENGWNWRSGRWDSDLSWLPESSRAAYREWLARRPAELRGQPFFWDDPQWNAPNLPLVGVCWFEAEAYCKWLSAQTGKTYRLPTEAEWEKAARYAPLLKEEGAGVRLWPWGNTWDAQRCNSSDDDMKEKLARTSSVGMYPHGASPYGALDMVGNVWEWCADWYNENEYKNTQADMKDPVGPETGSARVLRGGAWNGNRNYARCAARLRSAPDDFNDDLGFRLAALPIVPHL